jgi:hydroxypyruvate isomerase
MFQPGGLALGRFLDELKLIGFPAVEIWSRGPDFGGLVEEVRRRDMRLVSMVGHAHASPTAGGHAEGFSRAEHHDRLEAELRESINLAAACGMPGIIVLSGHRNPAESDYATLLTCARGLRRIAPYAEEKGVNLNMELLNTKIDHPRYLCDRTDWAVALCELVDSPRVKVLFDIYHMAIMEGDLIRSIRRASRWIGHFHTAGNPGRHALDDEQEINYPGICRAIEATGYELYLGHEFRPKGEALAALRQAWRMCGGG